MCKLKTQVDRCRERGGEKGGKQKVEEQMCRCEAFPSLVAHTLLLC